MDYLGMVPVFPDMPSSWLVSWWNISPTALALSGCSNCTEESG